MLIEDFHRIITTFADNTSDIDLSKGKLTIQIRDEIIEASLTQRGGELLIDEGNQIVPATTWIINRIARIPLLADRIISYISPPEHFVTPSASFLDQPDFNESSNAIIKEDATECALKVLGRRPAGTTSVLYLTSDAGEGKTTLINHLARKQALDYKAKHTDWLLLPIPLGGRVFLRFDDVVIAAIVNRLRFQFFYYEAFLELIRLGVIVPAFDGFEEMIIESSPGEAISALGNLVNSLHSSGTIFISARKAYFDYSSFQTQAHLFDAIGQDSVAFAKLSLLRWGKSKFIEYAKKRNLGNPQETYAAVAERLGVEHPLLTRAVLIKRLIDVALKEPTLSTLLTALGSSPQDYFYQFVNAIVEREAQEKWLDQSGEPPQPILTVDEHHELLAMVAQELWFSSSDALNADVIGAIADIFAESKKKPVSIARQLRERLKQHSLLVLTNTPPKGLAFDHEDFRTFYLGEALGRILEKREMSELRAILQVSSLPRETTEEALLYLRRAQIHPLTILECLQKLSESEIKTSFIRENCGVITIGLMAFPQISKITVKNMNFPSDSLHNHTLDEIVFKECYFQPTSLVGTIMNKCSFIKCTFERIEIEPGKSFNVSFEDCTIGSLIQLGTEIGAQIFDPNQIAQVLKTQGFKIVCDKKVPTPPLIHEPDEKLKLIERTLRIFLRSTQVNENVIKTRLGVKGNVFIVDILPDLLHTHILEEVRYLGSGNQKRYKLTAPMQKLQESLEKSKGNYDVFLSYFKQ